MRKACNKRLPRAARLLVLAGLSLSAACSKEGAPSAGPKIPLPDLAQVEPAVARRIRAAHAAVTSDPRGAVAWGRLGMTLDAHEFRREAIDAYLEAQRLAPEDYRWRYYCGVAWRAIDPREAVVHLAEAVRLAPQSPHVLRSYADALLVVDRAPEAEEVYTTILRLDPDHRGAMIGLGELALRRGDIEPAIQYLKKAEALAFHDNEVHEKLARACLRLGDEAAARRHAALAAAYPHLAPVHDPDLAARDEEGVSSKALSTRALALVRRGAHTEALATFRTLIALNPRNARYRANYAGALHEAGLTAEALAEFEEALRMSSTDPETFAGYAVALLDARRPAEAERNAREALRLNPQAAEPHHLLGTIRQQEGRLPEAEAEYRRAIALNAVHARAYNNLGNVLAAPGRIDEARSAWRSAVDCGLLVPEAVYNLAMASYLAGDMGEAAATLSGGLERYGEQPLLLAGLAAIRATAPEAHHRNGTEAIALVNRLTRVTGDPDAATADLLAAAFAEAGRMDEAVITAQLALKLARAAGDSALAAQIEARLALYRAGRPYHQQPGIPYRPPQPPTKAPRGWRR